MLEMYYYPGDELAWLRSLESSKYSQIVLVADAKSNGFCIPILKSLIPKLALANLIVLPDGEQNKTMDVCQLLWEQFQLQHVNRVTLIVVIGGGVLLDLVGFAAATYMRGIGCVYVPTTLMAMADASVGGKTAIDFMGIKNLIGAYSLPKSLYINPIFLKSLPTKHLRNGAAEMIKHGILKGGEAWKQLAQMSLVDFCALDRIKQSIEFKSNVVSADFYDTDQRQILNFGHTLGHAIESAMLLRKKPLLHGEAVMLGMDLELLLSKRLFDFPESEYKFWLDIKGQFFPQLSLELNFEDIVTFLRSDKKNDANIRMSLLRSPGEHELKVTVSAQLIKQVMDES